MTSTSFGNDTTVLIIPDMNQPLNLITNVAIKILTRKINN